MMKDDLEKFVHQNRLFFDTETPSPLVWETIEAALDGERRRKQDPTDRTLDLRVRVFRTLRVAAAVLLVVVFAGIAWSYLSSKQPSAANQLVTIGDLTPEYAELENFYTQKVGHQLKQLKQYAYDQTVLEDIAELDVAFLELQSELAQSGNSTENEVIIEAMIQNYRTKIEILERVLNHLKKEKKESSHLNQKPTTDDVNL